MLKKIMTVFLIFLFIFSTVNFAVASSVVELSKLISNLDNLNSEQRSELQNDMLEMVNEGVLTIDEAVNLLKNEEVANLKSSDSIQLQVISDLKNLDKDKIQSLLEKNDEEEVTELFREAIKQGYTSEEIDDLLNNENINSDDSTEVLEDIIDNNEEDEDEDEDMDDNDDEEDEDMNDDDDEEDEDEDEDMNDDDDEEDEDEE